ncbi:HAD family hydrolase [Schinkia sp. CFF1]
MIINMLEEYDIVIFDCDGVIIDSNLLKCEAFGKAVDGYPNNIVESFVDHCKKTFGISRYFKFREFFNEFANEPYDDKKFHLFLDRYEKLCKELYSIAELTPSVKKVLSSLNILGHKLYVASGSDERELIEVFEQRSLVQYFEAIYGSPKKKTECVASILDNNLGLKAVFIGDALSDLNTAKEHNLDFIYMNRYTVQSKEQDEVCRREAKVVINTLDDFLMVQSLYSSPQSS